MTAGDDTRGPHLLGGVAALKKAAVLVQDVRLIVAGQIAERLVHQYERHIVFLSGQGERHAGFFKVFAQALGKLRDIGGHSYWFSRFRCLMGEASYFVRNRLHHLQTASHLNPIRRKLGLVKDS